jgi:hypothetical protein
VKPAVPSILRAVFLPALLLPAPVRVCAAPAAPVDEIRHLLVFIEDSGCTFVRNDREYSAAEAREHIARKYAHIRNRIRTAEDLIDYAATRSSLSGRPYRVLCNSTEIHAADWLRAELALIRSK